MFLRVQAVRIRGQVAGEAAMGAPNENEAKDPVGDLVADLPETEDEKLRRVRLGDVHGLEAIELQGNHTALADGLRDAGVHAALSNGRSAVTNRAKHFFFFQ